MTPAGADNLIAADGFVGTWSQLAAMDLPPAAAVFVRNSLEALKVVWQHAIDQRETLVAAGARYEPALVEDLLDEGLSVVRQMSGADELLAPNTIRPAEPGRVWLLTSGSTGRPKRVAHTLQSLLTVKGAQPPRVWLCPYTPGAYAWWQVVSLTLLHPEQSLVCVDPTQSWAATAAEHGVTAASGTPTFWRQALMTQGEELSRINLRQITLGGEPVDQDIIDLLSQTFPDARVSWIYASSEAGASIAVHDGKAGFPEHWLDRISDGRPRLSVDGIELLISSPHRGLGVNEVLRTGDRVEYRYGRVHIVGRLGSDEINVGGSKVSASHVRDTLLSHPGVSWAAVKGRRAPMVGQLVQANVVLKDPAVTEDDLFGYCRSRLSEVEVPRRIRFLDQIPLTESLKSDV